MGLNIEEQMILCIWSKELTAFSVVQKDQCSSVCKLVL